MPAVPNNILPQQAREMTEIAKADLNSETELAHSRELIVMSVREFRGWTKATPLPGTPSFVRGVVNLRGSVLPIVDLAARLGFPPAEPTACHVIIVAQIGPQIVGILVDEVSDILNVTSDLVQPTPDVASEMAKTFVRGVVALDQRMISLIALDQVLPICKQGAA
jgi:purine-binding chemotaxis protein CheW